MAQENEILDEQLIDNIQAYENASVVRRYCNGFIDVFFILVIHSLVTSFLLPAVSFLNKIDDYQTKLIFTMYSTIVFYYLFFEFILKGRTIGKIITKTKVINRVGNPPSIKEVFIRTIVRYMPFEFLTILTRNNKTALHDGASATRVIKI